MWPFRKQKQIFPSFDWVCKNIPPPGVGMNGDKVDFTPDRLWLERHEWRLLFVYDEMMHSRRLYHLIGEESINLGKAFTADEGWVMWKKKLGEETFPIAMQSSLGQQRRVKGEIHAVRPHVFWNLLDRRMMNGIEFRRERVPLIVPYHVQERGVTIDHNEFVQPVKAYTYVGVKEYWEPQLDGGYMFSPVQAFKPKVNWVDGHVLKSYYYYSRLEDATNF